MKEKWIKASVLAVVFILAIIGFSILTNRDVVDMTAAMEGPTLPTITFETEGYQVNTLVGYTKKMRIPAMRDTITPLDKKGQVKVTLNTDGKKVEQLTYEVYPLDGSKVLLKKTESEVLENLVLNPGEALKKGVEAVLCITLHLEGEKEVYYYTRIVQSEDYQTKECLAFVKGLHENILAKEDSKIGRYMEPNAKVDNSSLYHVTIESSLENVMWGALKPEVVGEVSVEIKEINTVYLSTLLKYRVKCAGDKEELYEVQEFFKVRRYGEREYLLAYDRTMEQMFDLNETVLTVKGVDLGITSEEVEYQTTADGNKVAFVKARQLWCYDRQEDALSLVFGFDDSEKEDERNRYDQHNVRIVTMDDAGNMTFMVYGYMNRGNHEGEVGVAFYYYNHQHNTLEEKAFISSDKAYAVAADELCKLVYYNNASEKVYLLTGGALTCVSVGEEQEEAKVLAEQLEDNQYVLAQDGQLVAYQKNGESSGATEIEVFNFKTEKARIIQAKDGETIRPLGFVGEDFVYGAMKKKHAGKTVSGIKITPMYQLEICDKNGTVVKTYQEKNYYISSVFIEDNMITLKRVKKTDNKYREVAEDYITNNEEQAQNNISLQTYSSTIKKKQHRLAFEDRIEDINPKLLKAKLVVSESVATKEIKEQTTSHRFYVYGAGSMKGVYDQAGYAVQKADEIEGVVVSSNQTYVWERGNQEAWYRIAGINGESKKEGETTLEACLRILLRYEGITNADIKGKEPLQVLASSIDGEALDLTGCSTDNLRYMIGKGKPVIAMKGSSSAVLLIGYQANTIIYMDPMDGKVKTHSMKAMDEMTEGSGNTFLGYAMPQKHE